MSTRAAGWKEINGVKGGERKGVGDTQNCQPAEETTKVAYGEEPADSGSILLPALSRGSTYRPFVPDSGATILKWKKAHPDGYTDGRIIPLTLEKNFL